MDGRKPPRESEVQERRADPRKTLSLHIHYHQDGSVDVRDGTLVDLTLHGAGLQTARPIPVGKGIVLELVAPHGETARVAAEVEYSRRLRENQYRIGLRFVEMSVEERDAIEDILRVEMPERGALFPSAPTATAEAPARGPRGLERRRAGRLATSRAITYKIFGASGRSEEEGLAKVVDLSLTGISMRTSNPIQQGISLQIEVVHTSGIRSTIEAECIYCRKEGEGMFINGLRFVATEKSDLLHFSRILSV